MRSRCTFHGVLLIVLATIVHAQHGGIGNIIGELRVARGDSPGRVLVELQFRGATMASAYSDNAGKFSFGGLNSNPYHIVINDEHYYPVDQLVVLDTSTSFTSFVNIGLSPQENKKQDPLADRQKGSSSNTVAAAEYQKHVPKQAKKEFDRGVKADAEGERDEAVRHYLKALEIAPEYYPAHNNLGSEYLAKADFAAARKEFEQVIHFNQGDAAAYFNLGNACMLMGQMGDAQQYMEEGMRREPNSALGHFLLGSLQMRLGKSAEAETLLRDAIRLDPSMAQARLQLVNLLLKRGRNNDAVTELRAFVAAFPDNASTPKAKQLLQKLKGEGATRD
jgi:tetratricopeptide (TPR) repeat protein